jgi:hypothetical protein
VADEGREVEEVEVVDGLPVVTEPGVVETRPTTAVTAVQATALAATGFVAGAATVAVVSRRRTRRAAKKRGKRQTPFGEIVSSNSFLIDVHRLRRD